MKPNFALSLSFDGLRLLHRAAGGWRIVGEVALDAADMAEELAVLRKTATALEPGGLRSKLLLPNEQIKYLSVDTPDQSQADRQDAARAALNGATPYSVDDLAYDISIDGDQTHVAAVARETLAEAEAFAVEHRFHPVCFAAIPGDHAFLGEPFFGPSDSAAGLLESGDTVEPDGIAVVVVGHAVLPEEPVLKHESEISLPPEPETPEPEAVAPEEPEPETSGHHVAANEGEAETPKTDVAPPEDLAAPIAEATIDVPTEPTDVGTEAKREVAKSAPAPAAEPIVAQKAKTVPAAAPEGEDIPAPSVAAPTGFASRRGNGQQTPAKLGSARREPALTAPPKTPVPPAPSVTAAHIDIEAEAPPFEAPPAPPAEKGGFLSRRRSKPAQVPAAVPQAQASTATAGSEKDRMTIFGARRTDVGGKPRFLGLILTAALLVFLAGVAAWASVFLDDGLNLSRLFGNREPETAFVDPPKVVPTPEILTQDTDIKTASLDPGLTDEDGAVLDALRVPVLPKVQELSEDQLEAQYAVSGIWPIAPQVPPEPAALIDIDDLYLTSIDPVSTANDAVALPASTDFNTDIVLAAVSNPLAAGTAVTLDARGLVVPTPEGALNPDGITVFLGPPPLVPPVTPTRFQSEPEIVENKNALAALRPRVRPNNLSESNERAQLGGLTRSELADIRPALRPLSLQQQAAQASTLPVDTDDAVAAALAVPPIQPPAIENATRYATTASLRPDTRPQNFSRIVRRAQRAKPSQETERVASAAAVAPRTVAPKIPSKASVSRQATIKNAINLHKVNLIGVYGKPSNRRALVRLGNGRYKKVVVGDRIDGGRVAAIGDSELRYTKGGRNVTLTMPN